MLHRYDVVVVGSGFGGGVASCRLAEAGWRVCVLERGRQFGGDDFVDGPHHLHRLFWHHRSNPGGLFDLRLMRDVAVMTAAGVGGGSLVYANVQLRVPPGVFEQAAWPAEITRDVLDPYYDRTEPALDPRETPSTPSLRKVEAFAAAAENAGRIAERLPLAVHFGPDRLHPFSGVAQQGCENLGRCIIGCPRLAKNTVDITYLARAQQFGAQIFPLREVLRLERPSSASDWWRVGFRDLQNRTKGSVEARAVVLAAGALGSTRLLLRNRRRLPGLSPALGSRFSGNGDALGAAFDPTHPDVAGAAVDFGPVMTSRVDFPEEGFMVADGGLPPNLLFLLEIIRGVNALRGWRRHVLLRAKDFAARVGVSDRSVTPRTVKVHVRPPISDSLVFLMLGRDAADGRMRLTPLFRRFDITWSKRASQSLFDAMSEAGSDLAIASHGDAFFALDAGPLGKFLTVHPLGGCPMGDDPATSVVDEFGRVRGHDGLLVCDGAVIPTALGINPSKTIAALAERIVERLAEDRTP
jgi:cholesterol oxidase